MYQNSVNVTPYCTKRTSRHNQWHKTHITHSAKKRALEKRVGGDREEGWGNWTNFEKKRDGGNIRGLHKKREAGTSLLTTNFFLFIFTLISILTALKEISDHEYLICSHQWQTQQFQFYIRFYGVKSQVGTRLYKDILRK